MRTHFGRLEAVVDVYRKGEGDVRKRLTAMLDKGFAYVRQDLDFIRLMHAVYYGPPGGAPYFDFDAYHQRYHYLISRFMEEGIKRASSGPETPATWPGSSSGPWKSQSKTSSSQASRIDRDTLRRRLDLVFDGLAADNNRRKGRKV